ncbi:MAG: hypothetical protein GY750_12365 [Lentisphaerae bacterium]|nr:hypothetical protein [Lentisphaerota bacterium]MCP4102208.1 hypothetical protein [Lentisphaerota bacterium]
MSWDGKDFDKPLIMLDFKTPQEAISKNAYAPDEDVEPLIRENMTSEQLIAVLMSKEMVKEACDFMSHCVNRRVGVWWAYSCVVALNKEIEEENKKNPLTFEERVKKDAEAKVAGWKDTSEIDAVKEQYLAQNDKAIKDIGKMHKSKITDPNDPLKETQDFLNQNSGNDGAEFSLNEIDQAIAAMDPKVVSEAQGMLDKIFATYETKHGVNPMKAIENEIIKAVAPEPVKEDTTHKDQIRNIIEGKLDSVKQYINETMNKYFPLKIPGLPKKPSKMKIDEALFSVKRWILTPTDENGKIAMDSAKIAASEPEGLCALSAYWSCSNLTPGKKTLLVPPPGLYSNGLKNTVFMCAMKKGGSLTYDERYEDYFNIGIACVTGIKTWDKEWKKSPVTSVAEDDSNTLGSAYGFGRS